MSPFFHRLSLITLLCPLMVLHSARGETDRVSASISARTGKQVERMNSKATEQDVADAVRRLLRRELRVDDAVQIALLNNRELQATLEEASISRADLVQAGLLKNPVFTGSWRFPDMPGGTDIQYTVAQDFLYLLLLPMRKKLAALELERVEDQVWGEVLRTASEVKRAFYTLQGHLQLMAKLRALDQTNRALSSFAQRLHEAGNISELDLANQEVTSAASHQEVLQTETQVRADRETLNRLMGLWGAETGWEIHGALPPLPAANPPVNHVEAIAIRQRLDLEAARQAVDAAGRALALKRGTRYLPVSVEVGADTERDPSGQRITGPTLQLELPIFDHGQGAVPKLEAEYRQAVRRMEALAIDIRADARESRDRLLASYDLAKYFGDTLPPERRKIVTLTLQNYNFMLKGANDVLLAKQNEIAAERGAVEALRDYWIARADLERSLGRSLSGLSARANAEVLDQKETKRHHD